MPPRREVPWDATVAEHLGVADTHAPGKGGLGSLGGIGKVIDGRYRIVELLGEGGMGAVYVAEHLKLRKQVAIKVIRAEFASNAQASARFEREAVATARLDHPHVASAIDSGKLADGSAYLVIQLVRGVSLAKHLDTHGKLAWGTAADLGSQIADALAAAHAIGIVHRDLKPDNILIETRDDGRLHARVVDFGIARVVEETATASSTSGALPLTRMGAILGTPGYMAPEQAVGDAVDARGDLYALGVILWECCVGRRLWQGESVTELVACQLGSTPPTLQQELGSQVSEAFDELVMALLNPAPSKRPAAAGPIRDALRRLALIQTAPAGNSLASAIDLRPARGGSLLALVRRPRVLVPVLAGVAVLLVVGSFLAGGQPEAVATPEPAAAEAPVVAPTPVPAPAPAVVVEATAPVVTPPVAPAPATPPAAPSPLPVAGTPPEATPEPPPELTPASAGARVVPPTLAADLVTLLTTEDKKPRKQAAERVLAYRPKEAVPVYLLNLAWLDKAASCANKRLVIEQMEADGDPRVLPALRRLSAIRRRGCGFFNGQDCFGCLRETLSRTIGRLASAAPPAP